MPEKGRQLDLIIGSGRAVDAAAENCAEGKQFLGVHFACCDVYTRVYPNRDRTAYLGHCPRCAKRVEFGVGPGGTDSRFFTAF